LVANQEAQALAAQTVAEGAGAQAPASDLLAEAAAASLAEASAPDVKTKLLLLAQSTDNLAKAMSNEDLTALGQEVVEDYDKDKTSRHDWEEMAEEMLALAAQDKPTEAKTTPWSNSSNVNVPLLTIAALQFNARMYPAAIKGDEAILCKVIGQDNGVPKKMPNPVHGVVQSVPQMDEQTGQPVRDEQGKIVPVWQVPPGGKAARARRVSDYLNTVVFYRMEGWEADTDALLTQLPIIGCAFRKVWWHAKKGACSAMVSALRVVVNENVRDLDTAPRITEEIPDTYFHEIRCKQREGVYLDIDLPISTTTRTSRGCSSSSIAGSIWMMTATTSLTLSRSTRRAASFSGWRAISARATSNGPPTRRSRFGSRPASSTSSTASSRTHRASSTTSALGHLLKRVGAVIDTCINQLIDAGTAQTAGGGFIASGLRLQGRSGRSVVKFAPGEYKTVEVSGDDLRRSIVDRTMPEVSPTTFQVLDFIMGFAREIGGFKDILTGQASATAPVGTVLAQIEQGLQVFNAVAKRFFRAAKDEYQLLYDKIGRYGGPAAAQDYGQVLDDAGADFAADFSSDDLDIRPVSDASAVTRMQKLAKAQYLESKMGAVASVGGTFARY
jgi:chaperonin GroES